MEYNSKYGIVHFHDTSWNTKSLKGKSLEIDLIESISDNTLQLISEFCNQKSKEQYILIASRISASLIELKKVFFQAGFITVEHTFDVSTFGLDFEKLSFVANKFPVIVEDYSANDISKLEDIAASEFKHGRFYEDPFIDIETAKNRNRNWITDLVKQKSTIKVLKKKDNVVGFMAYKIKDERADLVLGGVIEKYRHLSYGFLANVLVALKDVNEIKTLISSSNTDVINLYNYFGFKFENPQFGFHKHL